MKSTANNNHIFALVAVVFTVMFSISFIWNALLTDNFTSMAYAMQTSNFIITLTGAIIYFLLSTLMVNMYLFAFANKRPLYNSVLYGIVF